MSSKAGSVETMLEAIQGKLEALHADIKKFASHSVSFHNGESSFSRSTPVRQLSNGNIILHTPKIPIGRASRLCASNFAETVTPTGTTSPSFLPVISGGGSGSGSGGGGGGGGGGTGRAGFQEKSISVESPDSLHNRRRAEAAKQKLREFVKPMISPPEEKNVPELRSAPCAWLLSIAIACSYISGERITIEDILRQNRLGLHYVSFPSVTLAELFDVTSEFLTNHPKLREMRLRCEVATFDTETRDELGDFMGMGERLPIMTLSQFRKDLSKNDPQSICIVNFDPYLIEQHEIRMRLNYMELNDSEHPLETVTPRWPRNNQGTFGLILSFSPALHSVVVGTPILLEDGRIVIEEHTVPLQVLYKALCVKDNYCNRSRGFVRLFFSDQFIEKVPSIFPLNLLDGSLAGGMLSTALDTSIAPHILGMSLMHHLVVNVLLDEAERRRQNAADFHGVVLRGIPVTMVCQQLDLCITTIVGGSKRVSVASAFSWYRVLLQKLKLEKTIATGIVLVERRGGDEDGPVNIADDVFMKHIELAVESGSVLLIGFDVNIALNVKVDNRPEPCHFAIAIGIDQQRGIVRLADVNVKKYRKTWHLPVTRLYSAVIGYGYILAAKSQKIIDELNAAGFEKTVLSEARYSLPPMQRMLRFEYPAKNYVVTVLADAFDRLGFKADVKRVVNYSGFHLSFMLSAHLPLENAATVARNYSHTHAEDGVSVVTRHMDKEAPHSTTSGLQQQIRAAVQSPKSRCLIVNFQASLIHSNKEVWNGSDGGSYAIVLDFDEEKSLVTLSDANQESFYRTWLCPLDVLFEALSAVDSISLRARGTLMLTASSQHDMYLDCYGYDMRHSLVHHPFKPSVWPAFHCLALVASEMSSGDSTNGQCLQFSAEDFLYSMPSFSVYTVLAKELESEHIVALANTAFERLGIALEAKVVDVAVAGSFLKACCDEMVKGKPVTMTLLGYDTRPIHRVAGFSFGVINRVRGTGNEGTIQLVEGNGCAFGSVWERPAQELQHAVTAMVRIMRR
ncbi:uncharacterized protein Tco025E_08643 [Trypanosoma conorhini]|uniref:Uncharacterized protein n=1 Tax=Trypanosoma conorhini TaxID=83891 RepID=A0A3S5IQM5_9TRYP|nr:uncharacterized protein Tco025E_08643 [Trypanosoma conorhini]RNF01162.1 hypothetical protein Tco025E_08643 [Trypanosoma conorhini]